MKGDNSDRYIILGYNIEEFSLHTMLMKREPKVIQSNIAKITVLLLNCLFEVHKS